MHLVPALFLLGCATAPTVAEPPPHLLDDAIAKIQAGELDTGIAELESLAADKATGVADQTEARRWLGHAYTRLRDPESALEHYRQALAHATDDAWLHYAVGTAMFEMGRNAEAIESYSSAIRIDPSHLKALQWRAHTYATLEQHEHAATDFATAIELLDSADAAKLAEWGGDRSAMLYWSYIEYGRSLDALERHEEADRQRALAESIPR